MKISYSESQVSQLAGGPGCLRIIENYYKKDIKDLGFKGQPIQNNKGASLADISKMAEKIGFRARIASVTYRQLNKEVLLPCILQINIDRAVVILPFSKWKNYRKVRCLDPSGEMTVLSKDEFVRKWSNSGLGKETDKGMVLILEPMPKLYEGKREDKPILNWSFIFRYLNKNKIQVLKLILCLLITSMLQLIFPFLTQSLVDVGIDTKDLNYIVIVLIAQLTLVFSRTIMDFIRNHLLLYISTTFNLSILSDFWIKLTHLPISYFDQRREGEILQRIADNRQIQIFLTGPALQTLFAALNFVVFALALVTYKLIFLVVYVAGISLYFTWMILFLKIRRKINYQIFHNSSRENSSTLQMIQGMQEIKLLNVEQPKRWEWENIQSEVFRLDYKNLSVGQIQQAGAIFINQGKDIVLTFIVAELVVKGQLTFGALLAVQYIIGQLSGPVEQFIRFVQEAQYAKIAMERLNEVHQLEDEENHENSFSDAIPIKGSIRIRDLCFHYPGAGSKQVLQNIELDIPEGKTTAIVGVSGGGKTTLLKLLLKFHDNYKGSITVGESDFSKISPYSWRQNCSALLQDGYVFNDTVEKNIAVEFGEPESDRLLKACEMANIRTFIESLPEGFKTRLGVNGVSFSQGQRQRLLIARAIYKNPQYVFFDESTNALDANTEKAIVENLKDFFKDKTVVIVAHRLSTVKNADKIVVLDSGRIIEQGCHYDLSLKRGRYFELVRNQLEFDIRN